jgi:hypothetical protein
VYPQNGRVNSNTSLLPQQQQQFGGLNTNGGHLSFMEPSLGGGNNTANNSYFGQQHQRSNSINNNQQQQQQAFSNNSTATNMLANKLINPNIMGQQQLVNSNNAMNARRVGATGNAGVPLLPPQQQHQLMNQSPLLPQPPVTSGGVTAAAATNTSNVLPTAGQSYLPMLGDSSSSSSPAIVAQTSNGVGNYNNMMNGNNSYMNANANNAFPSHFGNVVQQQQHQQYHQSSYEQQIYGNSSSTASLLNGMGNGTANTHQLFSDQYGGDAPTNGLLNAYSAGMGQQQHQNGQQFNNGGQINSFHNNQHNGIYGSSTNGVAGGAGMMNGGSLNNLGHQNSFHHPGQQQQQQPLISMPPTTHQLWNSANPVVDLLNGAAGNFMAANQSGIGNGGMHQHNDINDFHSAFSVNSSIMGGNSGAMESSRYNNNTSNIPHHQQQHPQQHHVAGMQQQHHQQQQHFPNMQAQHIQQQHQMNQNHHGHHHMHHNPNSAHHGQHQQQQQQQAYGNVPPNMMPPNTFSANSRNSTPAASVVGPNGGPLTSSADLTENGVPNKQHPEFNSGILPQQSPSSNGNPSVNVNGNGGVMSANSQSTTPNIGLLTNAATMNANGSKSVTPNNMQQQQGSGIGPIKSAASTASSMMMDNGLGGLSGGLAAAFHSYVLFPSDHSFGGMSNGGNDEHHQQQQQQQLLQQQMLLQQQQSDLMMYPNMMMHQMQQQQPHHMQQQQHQLFAAQNGQPGNSFYPIEDVLAKLIR